MSNPRIASGRGSISNFVMTEWTPEGQADQTPKSLGLIIRRLRETFVVNENEVIIGLGASGVNPKRCRPVFAEAASRRQA